MAFSKRVEMRAQILISFSFSLPQRRNPSVKSPKVLMLIPCFPYNSKTERKQTLGNPLIVPSIIVFEKGVS